MKARWVKLTKQVVFPERIFEAGTTWLAIKYRRPMPGYLKTGYLLVTAWGVFPVASWEVKEEK